jgi:hypothetical protein
MGVSPSFQIEAFHYHGMATVKVYKASPTEIEGRCVIGGNCGSADHAQRFEVRASSRPLSGKLPQILLERI